MLCLAKAVMLCQSKICSSWTYGRWSYNQARSSSRPKLTWSSAIRKDIKDCGKWSLWWLGIGLHGMVEKDSYIRPQVIGTKGVLEFNHTLVKYQPNRSFFVLLLRYMFSWKYLLVMSLNYNLVCCILIMLDDAAAQWSLQVNLPWIPWYQNVEVQKSLWWWQDACLKEVVTWKNLKVLV